MSLYFNDCLLPTGEMMEVSLKEKRECLVKIQVVHQWALHSFSQVMVGAWAVAQGETSRAIKIFPPKVPRREEDPYGPTRDP